MTDAPKKWSASSNDDLWTSYETFDTREEAIESAPGVLGLGEGEEFYTGYEVPISASDIVEVAFDGSSLSDQLATALYDQLGDNAELTSTPEQDADLERAVHAAVIAWLERHNLMPRCFTIEAVEYHIAPHCGDCDETRECHEAKGSPKCCADEIPDGEPVI